MSKFVCSMCGFEYDEALGYPELDIAPGTKWEDLPDDFRCPWCGAEKEDFYKKEEEVSEKLIEEVKKLHTDITSTKEVTVTASKYNTYVCALCGFEYSEEQGYPELDIAPGTKWEDLPSDFRCPMCGAEKEDFYIKEVENKNVEKKVVKTDLDKKEDIAEVTPIRLSAICSNLARGYEKQYNEEGASLYYELAEVFKQKAQVKQETYEELLKLVKNDMDKFLIAKDIATENQDRGALRALVWAEKVNKMVASLLNRYIKGEDFDNLNVYVCTICGFIFVGDKLPEICPVCKVPNFKFERI